MDMMIDVKASSTNLIAARYVEGKLTTKFGIFNIRVYADDPKKENVLLWTGKLDTERPVLVRVHSECITGDTFGSYQCDCGEQLEKSLNAIKNEDGIFIYLRQEGRGIGLFEKIKAYNLQRKGYDTFEANVLLGHLPDARNYKIVKTMLQDLNVKKIRLFTNNPSKISDIAKLGIEVVERVPLIIDLNTHNKAYLEAKKARFDYFTTETNENYFYQFHADELDEIKLVMKEIKNKKRDFLLQICAGISANIETFLSASEYKRISSIFQYEDSYKEYFPILHFSFKDSKDILSDIKQVKIKFPFVKYLQLNDLPDISIDYIKEAAKFFSLYLPLSDETFYSIHDDEIRDILKENKAYILLDNSKGRAISESRRSFQKKIDILLAYGLNRIVLCGGFGPNKLNTYFELRRYYRINFSIDAESKLKTNSKVDAAKTKLYLLQLIRFNDPNFEGIDQTKKFLENCRRKEWEKVIIGGKEFLIHPHVFHPGHFPSTAWFASELVSFVKDGDEFCEVGCGAGVIACLIANACPNSQIVATDINPYASENTTLNARRLNLEDRLKVYTGDVLDSIKENFDAIFWAMPFGFLDPGTIMQDEDYHVFDAGYQSIYKFFQTAKTFLKPHGKLLIGFSSELGNLELLEEFADEFGIKLEKRSEIILTEADKIKFELLIGTYDNIDKL